MAREGAIRTSVHDSVGRLTISSPGRRNALSFDMYRAIPDALGQLVDAAVGAIVISGDGTEAFCAGSDVSEFATIRTRENWRTFAAAEHAAHGALLNVATPTIAAIRGHCRGGGLALAACADIRVCDDTATFAVPPGKLGIGYPPDGLEVLKDLIGVAATKDLVMTARTVTAAEALDMGLVARVFETESFDGDLSELVDQVASLAPLTLAAAKIALNPHATSTDVVAAWERCYDSDDYAEGVAAFVEKRRPNFRGN